VTLIVSPTSAHGIVAAIDTGDPIEGIVNEALVIAEKPDAPGFPGAP
jgi:hypothetical protein